jgi:predicted transcriptional regulator
VLDAGHDIYRYDGDLEYNLAIADSIVLLGFDHEDGGPKAVIESTNERVLGWVKETFERYRCEAVPIGPNALSVG